MMPDQSVARTSRGRGLVITGAVLAGVSLVLVVVAGVLIGRSVGGPLISAFTSPARTTPVDASLSLNPGRYTVFERTGTSSKTGPVTATSNNGTTVTPDDVTVTGPDGDTLATTTIGGSETITREDAVYTGAVRFRVPAAGTYRVRVDVPAGTEVVVAPALGTGFRAVLPWVAIGAISTFVLIVGSIVLAVGLVRRHSARRRVPAPAAPAAPGSPSNPVAPNPAVPAGWYPAPDVPGRQRFWDGKAWTERLQ